MLDKITKAGALIGLAGAATALYRVASDLRNAAEQAVGADALATVLAGPQAASLLFVLLSAGFAGWALRGAGTAPGAFATIAAFAGAVLGGPAAEFGMSAAAFGGVLIFLAGAAASARRPRRT